MFLGYPHGWKLYDLATKKIFVSRDVHFYETIFPFAQGWSQHQDLDQQPVEGNQVALFFNDLLHVHDDGPVISMGGNHTGRAHSSPLVIEHASSVQMPAVDLGTDDSVAAPNGPNAASPTLDPLPVTFPAHDVRAGALIFGPTEADGPSNETTEDLVI